MMITNEITQKPRDNQSRVEAFALVVAVGICVLLSAYLAASSSGRLGRSCEIRLDDKINPNTASAASLARLPGIGISKADAIVSYRRSEPFRNSSDLQNVKGIGPKTAQNIIGWLKFE